MADKAENISVSGGAEGKPATVARNDREQRRRVMKAALASVPVIMTLTAGKVQAGGNYGPYSNTN